MSFLENALKFQNNLVTTQATPDRTLLTEVTKADSAMYEPYTLRPFNPAELYQKRGNYDIYDDMLEDDQVSAVIKLKQLMVVDNEWAIETKDENIKEFFEWNLKHGLDETFDKKMINMLTSFGYGFSLTEKIFAFEEIPDIGNKIIIKMLKTRAPHPFEFDQDDFGNITQIRQDTMSGKTDDLILKTNKFIHYINDAKFDNPYGNSELNEGVYRAYWSKGAIIKMYNIFLERHGMPTVVATLPTQHRQQRASMETVLKNIQAKTNIIIPEGITLDLLESSSKSGDSNPFESAISMYNMFIARALLIPDLMGFSGNEISGGSFALGKEHFGIFFAIVEQERKQLEMAINRELIAPLTLWNFGSGAKAEFKFKQVDDHKIEKNLRIWLDAVNGGKIPVTDAHVNWFLDQVDAPEITEEELAEIQAKKDEMALAIQGGGDDNGDGETPKYKEAAGDKGDTAKKNRVADDGDRSEAGGSGDKQAFDNGDRVFFTPFRELTRFEKGVNFAKIERDTMSIENDFIDRLGADYKLVINRLIDDIKRKKIIEGKKFQEINKLSLKFDKKVQKSWDDMFKASTLMGISSVPIKQFQEDVSALNNDDVVAFFDTHSIQLKGVNDDFILNRVRGILQTGIKSGLSNKEIIKQIRTALQGYDVQLAKTKGDTEDERRQVDEIIRSGNRLDAIVRTEVNRGFNQARLQQFEEMSDQIVMYFYSAILDGRTSDICLSFDSGRNQKLYKPDEASAINPPNHVRCRSLLLPVFQDESTEGFNIDGGIPGNLVASDGDFFRTKRKDEA